MTAPTHSEVVLKNGVRVPSVGLGTWLLQGDEAEQVVGKGIDAGFRHIDTAFAYLNEREVGNAIAQQLATGKLNREDIFLTTKLWNTFHLREMVRPALRSQLEALHLDYIDLYLIHWPISYKDGNEPFPPDPDTQIAFSTADYLDTWRELERALDEGLVRAIGVSNFNHKQIERVESVASVEPMMLQVEVHPYLANEKLVRFAQERGIQVTAYSPFGAPLRPWITDKDPRVLNDPEIQRIAQSHQRTPAQVVLRWCLQRDLAVIPKSTKSEHLVENLKVFDWTLTQNDMESIGKLDRGLRGLHEEWARTHPHYPFNEPF